MTFFDRLFPSRKLTAIIRVWRIENNPRARRWNDVRSLDENAAAKRRVLTENKAEVEFNLRKGVKRG